MRSKETLLEAALDRLYKLVVDDDTATESARRAADSLVRYCTKPDPDSDSCTSAPKARAHSSNRIAPSPPRGEGRGEGHQRTIAPRTEDDEDRRLNAALDILRRARPDIDFDDFDDDDESVENVGVGGAVAELVSATNASPASESAGSPHTITVSPTHRLTPDSPGPAP